MLDLDPRSLAKMMNHTANPGIPDSSEPNSAPGSPGANIGPAGKPTKKSFHELFSCDELWHYGVAAVTYIILGLFLKDLVLNWIVGPLFIVVWMWKVQPVVDRKRTRQS